jgi:anti-anti-sigma factor
MAANPGVPGPALKLETERTPSETIVHCTGKITLETVPQFQDTIRALIPEAKCIVVDLRHVAHIDSAGLGALVGVWSSARKKSAEMGFRWPEPHGAAVPTRSSWFISTSTSESCFALPGWIRYSASVRTDHTSSPETDQHSIAKVASALTPLYTR